MKIKSNNMITFDNKLKKNIFSLLQKKLNFRYILEKISFHTTNHY